MNKIAFTVLCHVTLDDLCFDQQWYDELISDGHTPDSAIRVQIKAGAEEDPSSLLEEIFGGDFHHLPISLDDNITNVRLVP